MPCNTIKQERDKTAAYSRALQRGLPNAADIALAEFMDAVHSTDIYFSKEALKRRIAEAKARWTAGPNPPEDLIQMHMGMPSLEHIVEAILNG